MFSDGALRWEGSYPTIKHLLGQLLTIQLFSHKTPYTPPSCQKIALSFVDLLVFKVDEVCNISNKYKRPYNLAKYQYFYTKGFISLLHFETKLALSIVKVFQNIQFLPNFHYFQQ